MLMWVESIHTLEEQGRHDISLALVTQEFDDRLSDCPHRLPLNLRTRRLPEVLRFKGVESGASKKNLRSHLSGHVLKQVTGDVREVGVEVGIVRRNTHPISANEARRGRDMDRIFKRPFLWPELYRSPRRGVNSFSA